jgi:hypothetical protein
MCMVAQFMRSVEEMAIIKLGTQIRKVILKMIETGYVPAVLIN